MPRESVGMTDVAGAQPLRRHVAVYAPLRRLLKVYDVFDLSTPGQSQSMRLCAGY